MSAENMENAGQLVLLIVFCVGLFIVIFLLLREFYCWYFKINRHLKNQAAMENKLNALIEEQRKTNALLERLVQKDAPAHAEEQIQ